VLKDRLSDAGGRPTPSHWRERHPAIKGLRPPEHQAGRFHPDQEVLFQVNKTKSAPRVGSITHLKRLFQEAATKKHRIFLVVQPMRVHQRNRAARASISANAVSTNTVSVLPNHARGSRAKNHQHCRPTSAIHLPKSGKNNTEPRTPSFHETWVLHFASRRNPAP
jgi:hypothetical protein